MFFRPDIIKKTLILFLWYGKYLQITIYLGFFKDLCACQFYFNDQTLNSFSGLSAPELRVSRLD